MSTYFLPSFLRTKFPSVDGDIVLLLVVEVLSVDIDGASIYVDGASLPLLKGLLRSLAMPETS